MKPVVSVYHNHPYCSTDSALGVANALQEEYDVKFFTNDDFDLALQRSAMIVFPGGIGDADHFHKILEDKKPDVQKYVENGGKYLGICMGAYWADHRYFGLLKDLECNQYIKQPETETTRSYGTVVDVLWWGRPTQMYFYDGCVIDGVGSCEVVAKYAANHNWAAVIQGNVGVIGPHPEATKHWFTYKTHKYMKNVWHEGRHWNLLSDMVCMMLDDRNC